MSGSSESRLAAVGRAAPVDTAAAIIGAVASLVVATRPELVDNVDAQTVAATCTGVITLAAALRAWIRSRRRMRESRRAARRE